VDCHVASLLAMTGGEINTDASSTLTHDNGGGLRRLSDIKAACGIPNLHKFSDVILHDNEAQMKSASGAYIEVRERARRNCNEVSVQDEPS
jgi:hypothetical protein